MKVLVDTSVWSLALRRKTPRSHPKAQTLSELIASGQSVFLTGIILQETLQGVRDAANFARLDGFLEPFPLLIPERSTFKQAAQLFSKCRAAGTPVPTVDCLIAAIAIAADCRLLTDDGDFDKIAAVSKLRLL
jgi:predicted nucleic acid-binding protein